MNLRILLTTGVAAIACAASIPANATPLLFDFSGPSGTALFQLDSNPTPDASLSFLGSEQFSFNNVAGTFAGLAETAGTISFGNGLFAALSITAPHLGFTQFTTPTLFTGAPAAPMFLTGSFTLINPFFGNAELTISPVATAVPEPATWAMMLAGFGLAGAAMRYGKRRVTARFAFA